MEDCWPGINAERWRSQVGADDVVASSHPRERSCSRGLIVKFVSIVTFRRFLRLLVTVGGFLTGCQNFMEQIVPLVVRRKRSP